MPNIASERDAIQDQLANKYSPTPENIQTGFDSSLSPSTIKVIRPNVRRRVARPAEQSDNQYCNHQGCGNYWRALSHGYSAVPF